MSDTPKSPTSFEDLFNLPEHLISEIVNGEPVVSPRPAGRDADVSIVLGSDIVHQLSNNSGGSEEWLIALEPELRLGRDTLVADLAGWRRSRITELPSGAYFELAPDWVCENTSAATARLDRMRKRPCYARHGVLWLWTVEPASRSLEVYELLDKRWTFVGIYVQDEIVRAVPFDAIEINLAHLWS